MGNKPVSYELQMTPPILFLMQEEYKHVDLNMNQVRSYLFT